MEMECVLTRCLVLLPSEAEDSERQQRVHGPQERGGQQASTHQRRRGPAHHGHWELRRG